MSSKLYIYDNSTIKFAHDGKKYCIHIQLDEDPLNPRTDWDNPTTMACFHSRYRLGDDIPEKTPEEFWNSLVSKYVSGDEFTKFLMADELIDSHVKACAGQENEIYATNKLYDFWDTGYSKNTPIGEGIPYSELPKWMGDMSIRDCMKLLEGYCEWKNLYLYDHGGLTISTGRGYPYNDPWDSGQVGWIVISRNEFECWKNDPNWRMRADDMIDDNVEIHDQYLRGEVYRYTLYEAQSDGELDPEWEEIDSCCGFFGDNAIENGIVEYVDGLREAVLCGEFETGQARKHTVSKIYYEF